MRRGRRGCFEIQHDAVGSSITLQRTESSLDVGIRSLPKLVNPDVTVGLADARKRHVAQHDELSRQAIGRHLGGTRVPDCEHHFAGTWSAQSVDRVDEAEVVRRYIINSEQLVTGSQTRARSRPSVYRSDNRDDAVSDCDLQASPAELPTLVYLQLLVELGTRDMHPLDRLTRSSR